MTTLAGSASNTRSRSRGPTSMGAMQRRAAGAERWPRSRSSQLTQDASPVSVSDSSGFADPWKLAMLFALSPSRRRALTRSKSNWASAVRTASGRPSSVSSRRSSGRRTRWIADDAALSWGTKRLAHWGVVRYSSVVRCGAASASRVASAIASNQTGASARSVVAASFTSVRWVAADSVSSGSSGPAPLKYLEWIFARAPFRLRLLGNKGRTARRMPSIPTRSSNSSVAASSR